MKDLLIDEYKEQLELEQQEQLALEAEQALKAERVRQEEASAQEERGRAIKIRESEIRGKIVEVEASIDKVTKQAEKFEFIQLEIAKESQKLKTLEDMKDHMELADSGVGVGEGAGAGSETLDASEPTILLEGIDAPNRRRSLEQNRPNYLIQSSELTKTYSHEAFERYMEELGEVRDFCDEQLGELQPISAENEEKLSSMGRELERIKAQVVELSKEFRFEKETLERELEEREQKFNEQIGELRTERANKSVERTTLHNATLNTIVQDSGEGNLNKFRAATGNHFNSFSSGQRAATQIPQEQLDALKRPSRWERVASWTPRWFFKGTKKKLADRQAAVEKIEALQAEPLTVDGVITNQYDESITIPYELQRPIQRIRDLKTDLDQGGVLDQAEKAHKEEKEGWKASDEYSKTTERIGVLREGLRLVAPEPSSAPVNDGAASADSLEGANSDYIPSCFRPQ